MERSTADSKQMYVGQSLAPESKPSWMRGWSVMQETQENVATWKAKRKLTLEKISRLELDAQKPFDGPTITAGMGPN